MIVALEMRSSRVDLGGIVPTIPIRFGSWILYELLLDRLRRYGLQRSVDSLVLQPDINMTLSLAVEQTTPGLLKLH